MTHFIYPTLKINGITKICDDTIYSYNDHIIKYQWFDFQLQYVLEILGMPIKDSKTNLFLTRSTMCNIIKKLLDQVSNDIIFTSKNADKDIEMGIIPKKIQNIISDNNLGGMLSSKPEFNSNNEISGIKFKHSTKKLIPKKIKIKIKKPSNWLFQETQRVKKAHQIIGTYDNFLDYGRLDWYNNSCYADSVLILLLFPIFDGTVSEFVKTHFIEKLPLKLELIETENYSKYICNKNTIEKSLEILNNIYKTFNELYFKLITNNIINTHIFLTHLSECSNKFGFLSIGEKQDALEFLINLFSIFGINTTDYNVRHSYECINIPSRNYSSSLVSIFDEAVDKSTAGINNYDFTSSIKIENKIIVKYLLPDDLQTILRLNLKTIYTNNEFLTNNFKKSDYYYDDDIERWYSRKKIVGYKLSKNKQNILLSKYIRHKRELYPENSYHIYEGYKKIDINGTDYIISLDNKEKIKLEDLEPENDKAILIKKYIEELIIDNADVIFFGIIRKHRSYNYSLQEYKEKILYLKITPDEIIHINGKNLILRGIIVWYNNHYVCFFTNDGIWYKYDDNYNPLKENDYIEVIGNYSDLLKYSLKGIDYIVLKNSVIVWYH